jgi:hypothetical protein
MSRASFRRSGRRWRNRALFCLVLPIRLALALLALAGAALLALGISLGAGLLAVGSAAPRMPRR